MHHLDGAAGKTESHGPEGALSCPVGYLVEGRQGVLHRALFLLLRGEGHLAANATCDGEPAGVIAGGLGFEGCSRFGGRGGDRGSRSSTEDGGWDGGCGCIAGGRSVINNGELWNWVASVPLSARGAIVRDSENILVAILCVQSR